MTETKLHKPQVWWKNVLEKSLMHLIESDSVFKEKKSGWIKNMNSLCAAIIAQNLNTISLNRVLIKKMK